MRTTLDLPDDILRRAKIEAVERGSTLRQVVIDALQRELSETARPRKRLMRPPVKLAADAPLRRLTPGAVKRLDAEAVRQADESKARALHRRRQCLAALADRRTRAQAWSAVQALIDDPRILVIDQVPPTHSKLWYDCIVRREPSPDLWTDAWLAALAQAYDCEMVTFDRGFRSFSKLKLRLLDPVG